MLAIISMMLMVEKHIQELRVALAKLESARVTLLKKGLLWTISAKMNIQTRKALSPLRLFLISIFQMLILGFTQPSSKISALSKALLLTLLIQPGFWTL